MPPLVDGRKIMRESRVIAMAGVVQACSQVNMLAVHGRTEKPAREASIGSIFRIDSDSVEAVFGGLAGVRHGLHVLLEQIDGERPDPALTALVIGVLRLERSMSRRGRTQTALREGIAQIQRQVDHFGPEHPMIEERLAALYRDVLSPLRPAIMVQGKPEVLEQEQNAARIRSLLLAGLRAAVLWRQTGGHQLRLIFGRRRYAMLARGLLARCMIDTG